MISQGLGQKPDLSLGKVKFFTMKREEKLALWECQGLGTMGQGRCLSPAFLRGVIWECAFGAQAPKMRLFCASLRSTAGVPGSERPWSLKSLWAAFPLRPPCLALH